MSARGLTAAGSLIFAGAVLFGGCSSGTGTDASVAKKATRTTVPSTTRSAASDSTSICAIFSQIAANGGGPDAQFAASTPDGWARRIALTGEIVNAAPPEWRDEAQTYLQMVKDRAQLAADYGYVGVNDLPADVRTAFIFSHRAMQAEVDELIAYMKGECRSPATG